MERSCRCGRTCGRDLGDRDQVDLVSAGNSSKNTRRKILDGNRLSGALEVCGGSFSGRSAQTNRIRVRQLERIWCACSVFGTRSSDCRARRRQERAIVLKGGSIAANRVLQDDATRGCNIKNRRDTSGQRRDKIRRLKSGRRLGFEVLAI